MMRPLIIALHGFGSSPAIWSSLLPLMSQYGNVATPFLPGHMNAQQPQSIGVDAFADILLEEHPEYGEQPVVLIGHSLGGAIAAAMAEQLPNVLAWVGVDAPMIPPGSLTDEQKERYASGFFADYPAAAQRLLERNLREDVPGAIRQQLYDDLLDLDATFAARLWRSMFDWQPNLAQLQQRNIPLFAINGGQFPEEQRAHWQHLWQESLIADANHYPMIETPDLFAAQLDSILSRVTRD